MKRNDARADRRPIEPPPGPENELARLLRRVARRAGEIIAAEVEAHGERVNMREVERRLRRELLGKTAHRKELRDVARQVERSYRRQLSRYLSIPETVEGVEEEVEGWVEEVEAFIRRAVLGGRADDVRADGLLSVVEAARRAVEKGRQVGESVSQMGRRVVGAVTHAGRSAANVARAAVLSLGARVNKAVQRALHVETYIWRSQGDGRVRPEHRRLNLTRHRWDDPPVAEKGGARHHPGEGFNCRCVAIPDV